MLLLIHHLTLSNAAKSEQNIKIKQCEFCHIGALQRCGKNQALPF